ncbi:MAG: DMT family transporter [Clostridia bacterium]|nr:DMT family transporter [Clostridia bacterium]
MKSKITGHIFALITVFIWGVTYIATKILLQGYNEIQVIVFRLIVAYVVLWIIHPKLNTPKSLKDELSFIMLAVFGVVVYFLFENAALKSSSAANVSIIISFAPIATTIGVRIFSKSEKLNAAKIIGSFVAISGVILVVFNGAFDIGFNPKGDLLAIGAMLSWAIYSIISPCLLSRFDNFMLTRRSTFYSLISMASITLIRDGVPDVSRLISFDMGVSLLLLGVLGSGFCYIWWNSAIKKIGVVTTTNYLYLSPFITMLAGYFVLDEAITIWGVCGALLIIGGIVVSNKTAKKHS